MQIRTNQAATPPPAQIQVQIYVYYSLLGTPVEGRKLLCVFMHMCLQLPACVQPEDLSTHPHRYSWEGENAIGGVPILISDRAATARIKPQLSGAAGRQSKATWWGEGHSIHPRTTSLQKNIHLQLLIICLWYRPTVGLLTLTGWDRERARATEKQKGQSPDVQ